jgi:hypothetical protein
MAFIAGAVVVWLGLFAALQIAMKYDAEHAEAFAHPIDSIRTIDDVVRESHERLKDRRAG